MGGRSVSKPANKVFIYVLIEHNRLCYSNWVRYPKACIRIVINLNKRLVVSSNKMHANIERRINM